MKTLSVISAVWLCLLACHSNHQESSAPAAPSGAFDLQRQKTFIDSANLKFTEAIRDGDTLAIEGMYGPDAELMLSNLDVVQRPKIKEVFGESIRLGLKHFTFITTDVTGSADLIVNTGKYEMKTNDMAIIDAGKYVVVWKNYDGQWKIFRDIGNSSLPLATNGPK